MSIESQPVNCIQWVKRSELRANDYNPNRVSPIELDLLALSIQSDGWTQPIVARSDGEIVDGYHRWLVSRRPEIHALTNGKVPVVRINKSLPEQIMSTIRHNRARGQHTITPMSEIVRSLIDEHGLSESDVMTRLGMESEEVERLYDNAGMPTRAGKDKDFGEGWIPTRKDL